MDQTRSNSTPRQDAPLPVLRTDWGAVARDAVALAWGGRRRWLGGLFARWLARRLEAARGTAAVLDRPGVNWLSLHHQTARLRRRSSLLESDWCVVLEADATAATGAARAAKLVTATIEFAGKMARGELPEEREGSAVLDPQPYRLFFARTLRAGADEDSVHPGRGGHLLVLCGGRMYRAEVRPDERTRTADAWHAVFRAIQDDARERGEARTATPAAATAGRRDAWSALAMEVRRDNGAAFDAVEDALFVVALDDDEFAGDEAFGRHAFARGLENRWYDASLQIVTSSDGRAALLGNFALGLEGRAAATFSRFVAQRSNEIALARGAGEPGGGRELAELGADEIRWTLTPADRSEVERIADEVRRSATDTPSVFFIEGLSVDLFQRLRMQPDAGFTLALRMALAGIEVRGARPMLLQLIDMRRWRGGQVRLIRPPADAMHAAIAALERDPSSPEVRGLLAEASAEHMRALLSEKLLRAGSSAPLEVVALLTRFSGRATRLAVSFFLRGYWSPFGTFPVVASNVPWARGCAFHGSIGHRSETPTLHVYLVFTGERSMVTFHVGEQTEALPARVADGLRRAVERLEAAAAAMS